MNLGSLSLSGGKLLKVHLDRLQAAAARVKAVRVGFLEGATYPEGDGTRLEDAADRLTPQQKAAHPRWEYDLRRWAAYADVNHPAPDVSQVAFWNEFGTSTAPARPAFRNMISAKSPAWGDFLAVQLRSTDFNVERSLNLLGMHVKDQLGDAYEDWPADNADLTVHIKGFDKGLTDGGILKSSIDYEVVRRGT